MTPDSRIDRRKLLGFLTGGLRHGDRGNHRGHFRPLPRRQRFGPGTSKATASVSSGKALGLARGARSPSSGPFRSWSGTAIPARRGASGCSSFGTGGPQRPAAAVLGDLHASRLRGLLGLGLREPFAAPATAACTESTDGSSPARPRGRSAAFRSKSGAGRSSFARRSSREAIPRAVRRADRRDLRGSRLLSSSRALPGAAGSSRSDRSPCFSSCSSSEPALSSPSRTRRLPITPGRASGSSRNACRPVRSSAASTPGARPCSS